MPALRSLEVGRSYRVAGVAIDGDGRPRCGAFGGKISFCSSGNSRVVRIPRKRRSPRRHGDTEARRAFPSPRFFSVFSARARPATQAGVSCRAELLFAGEADPPPHRPRHAASPSSPPSMRRPICQVGPTWRPTPGRLPPGRPWRGPGNVTTRSPYRPTSDNLSSGAPAGAARTQPRGKRPTRSPCNGLLVSRRGVSEPYGARRTPRRGGGGFANNPCSLPCRRPGTGHLGCGGCEDLKVT